MADAQTEKYLTILGSRTDPDLQALTALSEACILGCVGDNKLWHAKCGNTACQCVCHVDVKKFPDSWRKS